MDVRRLAPLALLVPAAAAGATLAPRWPKPQVIRYELGDAAQRVEQLDARWAEQGAGAEWTREASFRYAVGRAPRVVTHEPRLADGDYTAEVEIVADGRRTVVRRRVTLAGGVTTLDLEAAAR
jgi:hypothetical protein